MNTYHMHANSSCTIFLFWTKDQCSTLLTSRHVMNYSDNIFSILQILQLVLKFNLELDCIITGKTVRLYRNIPKIQMHTVR